MMRIAIRETTSLVDKKRSKLNLLVESLLMLSKSYFALSIFPSLSIYVGTSEVAEVPTYSRLYVLSIRYERNYAAHI